MDSKITDIYMKMLLEGPDDGQGQLFRPMASGKRKGEEVEVSDKDQETGKHNVEDKPDLKLTERDLQDYAELDYVDQVRVKKYIQGKANRSNVRATFKGQDAEIEQAYRILMSSDMSSDDVESVIHDVNANKAVDSRKLTTIGNYAPLEIFGKEPNWEAYKQLLPVGVGKLQQGPGEVGFTMLSQDVDEEVKGDISIHGELYELKLNGGRISDKAGPNPVAMRNIIAKHLGDNMLDYFKGKQSLNTTEFVDKFINPAKQQGIDTTPMVKEIYSEILSPEYSEKMAQAFQGEQVDEQGVIEAFKEHSFDYYKSTKVGDGSWKKLIGINTIDKNGSVAVVETGAQFANTPMKNVNPAIVRTKSGTRENYVEFRPIQG